MAIEHGITPDALASRVARVASWVGAPPETLEVQPIDLSTFLEEGALLSIEERGLTFDLTIPWEVLGVSLEAGAQITISPPRISLVMKDIRRGIDNSISRARDALRDHCFKFSFLAPITRQVWVPRTAIDHVLEVFRTQQAALEQHKRSWAEVRWEENRDQVCLATLKLVRSVASRLRSEGVTVGEDFERKAIRYVARHIPTPEEILERIQLRLVAMPVVLGSEFLEEARKTVEARNAYKRATQEEALLEEHRAARARQLEQIRELERQTLEAAFQEAVNPIREVAIQFNQIALEGVEELRQSLRHSGTLHGSHVRKIKNLLQRLRLLDINGDASLQAKLQQLEAEVSKAKARRRAGVTPTDGIEAAISEIRDLTRQRLRELRPTTAHYLEA